VNTGQHAARLERRARYARDFYLGDKPPLAQGIPAELEKNLELSKMRGLDCVGGETLDIWLQALFQVARAVNPVLEPGEADAIWSRFEQAPCYRRLGAEDQTWVKLFRAVGVRDPGAMARYADDLLGRGGELTVRHKKFLLTASLVGNILSGQLDRAQGAWDEHSVDAARSGLDVDLRLLYAYLALAKVAPRDRPS